MTTVGLFQKDSKLWYISDTVIIVSNPEDQKIYAFPTVDDPTQDDWNKVLKVIKKLNMQTVGNRMILNSKECIEVKEN
jgi:MinD-like ATPase involved in chromosome partitioning or flagellar assembly